MAVFANPSLLLVMYLVTYAGGSGRRLKRRHTETKEVCEPWGTQEGDERYCYIQSFGMLGLGYTRMISEKLDVLHILCPEIVFTITVVGIEEIEYRGEAYEVKIEDPLKDFHKQAFESRCVDTFKALQTMILGKGEGKCTPIDEREGESRYCYVHSGELTGLGYSLEVTDDERVQALTVLCPRKNYTVTIDGIVEIEHQGESYDVKIDDPLKDFNKRAFDETEFPVTFRNIQTEILKKEGAAVDEGPSSLCKEIADEFCSIYEQATAGVNLTT
ncbi:hypothetical protein FOL47_000383 [Perkinsus chesapeaki]|uniref:Uncharacterized protein n=1 Tax=Perkinsus chesapeaki TaxID=330153 RepID=A0A7J6MLS1_PERCH|nr:hypothetical protein FOL47_000383 [Perkinsus chesapeaki]